MSTSPTLPQEIIDQIIEEIEPTSENIHTLQTCGTVSLSFRDPAQRQMLRVLHFHLDKSHISRNNTLVHALACSARLCSFVEELFFYFPSNLILCALETLPTFNRVRKVTLATPILRYRYLWESLPHPFRSVLRQIVQCPTLRTLSIEGAHSFPASFLNSCFHLQHLKFTNVSFLTNPDERVLLSQPSAIHNQQYIDLSLNGRFPCVETFLPALKDPYAVLSVTRIRKLRIGIWNIDDLAHWQTVLGLHGSSSIEELELSVHAKESMDLNLSRLHTLRRLRLEPHLEEPVDGIPRLLESLPATNNLAEVSISFCITLAQPNSNNTGQFHPSSYRKMDEVLSRQGHALSLKVVEFNFVKYGPIPDLVIRNAISKSMPQLFGAGRLLVKAREASSKQVDISIPSKATQPAVLPKSLCTSAYVHHPVSS